MSVCLSVVLFLYGLSAGVAAAENVGNVQSADNIDSAENSLSEAIARDYDAHLGDLFIEWHLIKPK